MSVLGIDRVTYGVEDLGKCRKFFLDWGLRLVREADGALDFETLNGCEVFVRPADDPKLPPAIEPGPTLRQVIWGVEHGKDLDRLRAQLGAAAALGRSRGDAYYRRPKRAGARFPGDAQA